MRHMGLVLRGMGVILLAVLGCRLPPDLKPPPQPDMYALPPESDKRFSEEITYPPEALEDGRKMAQPVPLSGNKQRPPGAVPGGMGMGGMSPGGGY